MGKNKKKKKQTEQTNGGNKQLTPTPQATAKTSKPKRNTNPLQTAQQTFLQSLPLSTRTHFFSPTHITPERRSEIWENQADLGEKLVDKHAWATPDERVLKVFQHFGPIVEVGCGSNAYWAKWMNEEGGVDVVAFDASLENGGKINATDGGKKKKNGDKQKDGDGGKDGLKIRHGGPSVLSTAEAQGRTLFICYPDEEEYQESESDEEDSYAGNDINDPKPKSMAAACLEHFTGSTIIHVGELFGDTLGLDQSPWGRSSSSEFQERLAAEYHCILKMKLQNNWLHVRDTLSVWKRSELCCMEYENDDEEDEDGSADEDYYKYVPPDETLPMDIAAPCVAHLLGTTSDLSKKLVSGEDESGPKIHVGKRKASNESIEKVASGNKAGEKNKSLQETEQPSKKSKKQKQVVAGNAGDKDESLGKNEAPTQQTEQLSKKSKKQKQVAAGNTIDKASDKDQGMGKKKAPAQQTEQPSKKSKKQKQAVAGNAW